MQRLSRCVALYAVHNAHEQSTTCDGWAAPLLRVDSARQDAAAPMLQDLAVVLPALTELHALVLAPSANAERPSQAASAQHGGRCDTLCAAQLPVLEDAKLSLSSVDLCIAKLTALT